MSHALEISDMEAARLVNELARPHLFDGVLPALRAWRMERDLDTGRYRLHLGLAECTYSAVMLDNYQSVVRRPGEADQPGHGIGDPKRLALGLQTELLTLSCLPVSSDGFFVFSKRSQVTGSHRGKIAPGINGNLEFSNGSFVSPDMDENGLPSPLLALAREAKEELGVDVVPDDITVLGLAKFYDPSEKGTHVLLSIVQLPYTSREVRALHSNADLLAGSWETEEELIMMALPTDELEAEQFAAKFISDSSFAPHATAVGLAALASLHSLPLQNLNNHVAASSRLDGTQRRGPISLLDKLLGLRGLVS